MNQIKLDLRNQIKKKVYDLSSTAKVEFSKIANEQLLDFLKSRHLKNILISYSVADEIDTHFYLESQLKNFNVFLPKVGENSSLSVHPICDLKTDVVKGEYGIFEPITEPEKNWNQTLDCIVIPARALDFEGNRLGRGKGFYDRFLSKVNLQKTTLVCMIYHCQFIPEVPVENFDVPIEYCITEKGVFHLRRKSS